MNPSWKMQVNSLVCPSGEWSSACSKDLGGRLPWASSVSVVPMSGPFLLPSSSPSSHSPSFPFWQTMTPPKPQITPRPPTVELAEDSDSQRSRPTSEDMDAVDSDLMSSYSGESEAESMEGGNDEGQTKAGKKRGTAASGRWTREEHHQFLIGMKLHGRGNWRTIAKHCVPTRTRIQVASHAQKYYRKLRKREEARSRKGNQVKKILFIPHAFSPVAHKP